MLFCFQIHEEAVSGVKKVVFAETSNGPKQQGPPAWIDRYQRISVHFPDGRPTHVGSCLSLGLTPLNVLGSSLGYKARFIVCFQYVSPGLYRGLAGLR